MAYTLEQAKQLIAVIEKISSFTGSNISSNEVDTENAILQILNEGAGASAAADVSVTPSGTLTDTQVQAALQTIFAKVNTLEQGGVNNTPSPQSLYQLFQNFDLGVIPTGWTQATSVGTLNYIQAQENGIIGMALLSAGGPGATRASIRYANGYSYLLNFLDCKYTKWSGYARRPATDNGFTLLGLANNGAIAPNAFGNTIAVIHDPLNMSGMNPGLLTTWLLIVRRTAGTFTRYNTGVSPTNLWQYFEFEYNAVNPLAYYVTLKINGVVVATVLHTDTNLISSAIGAAVSPTLYCGTIIGAGAGNTLRVNCFNLFRKWT